MYKFKFQKVLEHKQREEDDIKNALSLKRIYLGEQEKVLEEIRGNISLLQKEYEEKKVGKIVIGEIINYQSYFDSLMKKEENQINHIKKIEKEIEDIQHEFFEKRKEVRTCVRLKEKDYEKFMLEEEKKEQKNIDEMSNNMYNRRK